MILLKNSAVSFVFARYTIYGVQLLNTIWIGIILGPIGFATWSFIQLIMQYGAQLNFGLPFILTNQLAMHGVSSTEGSEALRRSVQLSKVVILSALLLFLGEYFFQVFSVIKFLSFPLFFAVLSTAVIQHYNQLWLAVARIENKLALIIFAQALPQILLSMVLLFTGAEYLVEILVGISLFSQIVVYLLLRRVSIKENENQELGSMRFFIGESLKLFLYNAFFYLIIITTRAEVSYFHTKETFGQFSFAFIFINVLLLGMDALGFLWFPKMIKRFSELSNHLIVETLRRSQDLYLTIGKTLIMLIILGYPFINLLTDKYADAQIYLYVGILSIGFYLVSFGLAALLMAKSKNHWIAWMSVILFLVNLIFLTVAFSYFGMSAQWALLVTGLIYLIQNGVLVFFVVRTLRDKHLTVLRLFFNSRVKILFFIVTTFLILDIVMTGSISWYGYVIILIYLVMDMFRWKHWKSEMAWMNHMEVMDEHK
jgi:O-antigen/teichoic acid export membrane protein